MASLPQANLKTMPTPLWRKRRRERTRSRTKFKRERSSMKEEMPRDNNCKSMADYWWIRCHRQSRQWI